MPYDKATGNRNTTCLPSGRYVLLVLWFSAGWLLNLLNEGDLKYVTEVKSNRVFKHQGRKLHVKDLVTVFASSPTLVTYRGKRYEVRTYNGRLNKVNHLVKIFVVRGDFCGQKETRFFVSNDLGLCEEDAIKHIMARWKIDYFFRESKAYLGLDEGKYQKLKCHKRHFYLCFIAWSIARECIRNNPPDVDKITTIFSFTRYQRKHL